MGKPPLNWGLIVAVSLSILFWIVVGLSLWLVPMLRDWALIAVVVLALIALYFAIGHIIDACLAYWRSYKEER